MVKRILVVLSGTPYTHAAIQHAVEIARRHDARVHGIAILDREAAARPQPVPVGAAAEGADVVHRSGIEVVRERIDAAIAEFEDATRAAGVDHDVLRTEGDPVQALGEAWRYHDLTLVGLRGLFEYGVVAEPKDALIRLITSGIRPIVAVSDHYVPIERVMVAYSGSLESAKTMKRFIQLRLWPDAEVNLTYFTCGEETPVDCAQMLADASAYCADWGTKAEATARVGGARDHLLRAAEEQEADLIVMGDSARSLLTRRVFGDTALHVIRNADRPLFLAH